MKQELIIFFDKCRVCVCVTGGRNDLQFPAARLI